MAHSFEQMSRLVPGITKTEYHSYITARSKTIMQEALHNREADPSLLEIISGLESSYPTLRSIFDLELEALANAVDANKR